MPITLIVEDRSVDRRFLSSLLSSAGHTVVEASDGIEALYLAERRLPDLVISDILMPTIDGSEFVRRLRGVAALARTPVIFYTPTYHVREARALAQACGVTDVLTHPSRPEMILATVVAALESRRLGTSVLPGLDRRTFNRRSRIEIDAPLAGDEAEARRGRLDAIVAALHQIAAEQDPEALLQRVCVAARDVTFAQRATIGFAADARFGVRWMASCGVDDLARTLPVPSPEGLIIGPVIADRRAIRIVNPDGRPERLGLSETHPLTYSCLVVPIASPGRVYGWLALANKLGASEFSDRDEEVALTLAAHAGVAYENARRFDELRKHAVVLETELANRRRVERLLRENDDRTSFALAAARMGVWEVDIATRRLTWSDTMALVCGLAPERAPCTSDGFLDLIHPDDRDDVEASFTRAIAGDRVCTVEFRVVWPDGSTHWIFGRVQASFDAEAVPLRLLGVGVDIDERRSLEDQLRHAQKMDAIGQLAGGVAHDFNNLLTAIKGYSSLLLSSLAPDDDERRSDIEEIIIAADRATSLTGQLLAFSRKQILQPTLLDLNELVGRTSRMLRRLIGEDIELVTVFGSDLGPVRADAGQIEQIVVNLAVNARDAMVHGGQLTIETNRVELDESYAEQHIGVQPGAYVMLTVGDTGTGIDPATLRRVFEPFFTTKERGKGTGLGLATVYGIVKQSGGHVWVHSEVGRGTTFQVYLPSVDGFAEVEGAAATESPQEGTETVLLVEDEQAVRFVSRTILEKAGYHVLDADDPACAATLFAQHGASIDLLVTDVIMPGGSGPGLFKRLALDRPDLKVLFMSGYTDDAIFHQGELEPGIVFLQKPFTTQGLLKKVREALKQ
jgi:PAS domain S-box-containing protein